MNRISIRKLPTCLRLWPAAALLLAACGGPADGPAEQTERAPATEPQYGGNVVLGVSAEPVMFNTLYSQDTLSGDISALLFVGLMQSNENLEVIPHVAVDYPQVSADGTEWTYTMHEGVLFHDGVELTAHDVVFTYDILIHPDYTGPRAGSFNTLERVEALDDYRVRFTLSEPDARFETLAGYEILPRHLLEHVPVAELGDYRAFNVQAPIGAGPFRFVSWTRGQNLAVEAFEDYFEGRPYLDRVTFRFASDSSAAVLLLETGAIDHLAPVPTNELATVERMGHVQLHNTLALRYDYIGWNLRNPLFQDRRVRQALTHAIDRQEIVETLMEGHAEVAHSPISPLSWAYNDEVPRFDFDPERAKELLAEAGWTPGPDGILQRNGQRFSFQMLSNDGNVIRRDIGVIVQQYLRAVGIEVRPAQMEWGAFLDRIQPPNYNFDSVVLAWAEGLDPNPSAIWHSREIERGLNNISFSHPRVDELADMNVYMLDRDHRAAMLAEIWRIIAEEQPYTFLFYPQQFVGQHRDLRGFTHHPRLDTYRVNEWWLDR